MQLMSIEDLAVYLGVSKRTIYKYLADGDCPPYIKLSSKNISFDRGDVDTWLESKKVYPPCAAQNTSDRKPCSGKTTASSVDPDRLPWTPRAEAVLNGARQQAREDGFAEVGTEHLLLAMLSLNECLGAVILERLAVSRETCRHRYEQVMHPSGKRIRGRIPLSVDVDEVTQCAREQAGQWGHTYIGAEHLLAGILMTQRGVGFQILTDLGVTLDRVREETAKLVVCHCVSNE
ncbi:MAG: helix-turn-helix domain-containing protein [Phycisphaerae bacterium]|nr:helix-turn-helix domain-containing protein [Phycisphaerae bacterium]